MATVRLDAVGRSGSRLRDLVDLLHTQSADHLVPRVGCALLETGRLSDEVRAVGLANLEVKGTILVRTHHHLPSARACRARSLNANPSRPARACMGVPGMYCAVWSLKALQKFMRFRPRCPSAEPTGGCGVAFPAGTVSRKREASRPAMFPRGRGARIFVRHVA